MQLDIVLYSIVAEPDNKPVTKPVTESTEATAGFVECHLPPVAVSIIVVVLPRQMDELPMIGGMYGATVTGSLIVHPEYGKV